MNIKFNIIILLFCFGICLSACKTKQYEIELLLSAPDESYEETEKSVGNKSVIDSSSDGFSESINDIFKNEADLFSETSLLRETNLLSEEIVSFVHICGAVMNPGVYEVLNDSRVFEVLNLAGGFTDDAATDAVNLAMTIIDGSKIQIPTKEEIAALGTKEIHENAWVSKGYSIPGNNTAAASGESSNGLTDLVNINTASLDMLMTLPGIGKAKAESIILYREEKGKFNIIEDIMKITGIKDAVFGRLKDKICV
ncbi:MAG: helix-hairpin-helix domain-containing protein [Lachnospiraceae bacterium]|nr:helix-hairpin-helix domain-containing protein [Lachnospiraceae bacterium]